MRELDWKLRGGDQEAKLLFLMEYPEAREKNLSIAWLQQRKLANDNKKDAYQKDLDKIVKQFAARLMDRPEFPPDLTLVPPSSSRLFEPYLNHLLALVPGLIVCDIFEKPKGFEAGVDGQEYNDVLAAITLKSAPPAAVKDARCVMIIDDIVNTGNTAAAMVSRIRSEFVNKPTIVVACVLYVPLEPEPPQEPLFA